MLSTHMRNIVSILLILAAAACDHRTAGGPAFRAALVTTGSVGDNGWNAAAYDGLQRVKNELGAQVSNVETRGPGEYEETFRDYASRGYPLVFGHGFEYQDAALKVAPQFPKTTFLITSGSAAADNVVPVIFDFGQATYLAGMVAAAVSKFGKLGAVGGQPFPPVKQGFAAFLEGARAVNPRATLTVSYVGNWEDAAAAKEAAMAQIHMGVDVIIQNADAAGMGVFQAVRETAQVLVVGTNRDQNQLVPDRVLGSAVNDVGEAFVIAARQVKAGRPPRGVLRLGVAEGVVRFVPNAALASRWARAQDLVNDAERRLRSGSLQPAALAVTQP